MNTLLFLCGAGFGAFLTACVMMLLLARGSNRAAESAKQHLAYNLQTLDALRERNDIGRDIAAALAAIVHAITEENTPREGGSGAPPL